MMPRVMIITTTASAAAAAATAAATAAAAATHTTTTTIIATALNQTTNEAYNNLEPFFQCSLSLSPYMCIQYLLSIDVSHRIPCINK